MRTVTDKFYNPTQRKSNESPIKIVDPPESMFRNIPKYTEARKGVKTNFVSLQSGSSNTGDRSKSSTGGYKVKNKYSSNKHGYLVQFNS